MGRFYHKLEFRNTFLRPKRIVFFDTETNYQQNGEFIEHEFWFGYLVYREGGYRTEKLLLKKDDFWDFIDFLFIGDKEEVYVVAHNCFFDFMIIGGFASAFSRGFHLVRPPVSDKGLFIALFERGKERVYFLNLGNWFKSSVKELGKTVGLQKLDMPPRDAPFDQWVMYCKRDVEVIEKVFIHFLEFIDKNDLGGLSYTIAAQAFNSYLYRFKKHEIFIHSHEQATELERRAYHGGRTEAFYIGEIKDKVYVLDVHSMYPSIMRDCAVPVKFIKYLEKPRLDDYLYYRSRGYLVIADVLVKTDKPIVPLRGERLIAPVGKFRTALTSVEIDFLFENGGDVLEWYGMSVYIGDVVFKDYVEYFYHYKEQAAKENNKVDYMLYKLFLNSLYGKFGQRSPKWNRVGTTQDLSQVDYKIAIDALTGKKHNIRIYAGVVEQSDDYRESAHSFVAVSAFITAYGWVKITNYIIKAGWENVYYTDTDSIFTNEIGYNRLLKGGYIGDELGMLGLEYIADGMYIYGLKDYQVNINGKRMVKMKGVSKDAVAVIPDNTVIRIFGKDVEKFLARCEEHGLSIKMSDDVYLLEDGIISLSDNDFGIVTFKELSEGLDVHITDIGTTAFAQLQWLSFAGHVRERNLMKYINRIIVKRLRREYKKGIITKEGWVKPFEMNDVDVEQSSEEKLHVRTYEIFRKFVKYLDKLKSYKKQKDIPEWVYKLKECSNKEEVINKIRDMILNNEI